MSFDEILNNRSEQVFADQRLQDVIDLMERVNKMWLAPYQFHDWDFAKLRKAESITITAPDERGYRVWTVHTKAPADEVYCCGCGDRHKPPTCY